MILGRGQPCLRLPSQMTRSRIGIQKTIPRSTASAVLCARLWCCFAVFQLVGSSALAAEIPKDIEKNFIQPPSSCRPWVNRFWMDGNITKEGITADLEAMQRVGIGGALLMDVSQQIPEGPVRFGAAEWFALFHHAAVEAARLGLKLSLN